MKMLEGCALLSGVLVVLKVLQQERSLCVCCNADSACDISRCQLSYQLPEPPLCPHIAVHLQGKIAFLLMSAPKALTTYMDNLVSTLKPCLLLCLKKAWPSLMSQLSEDLQAFPFRALQKSQSLVCIRSSCITCTDSCATNACFRLPNHQSNGQ